MAANEVYMDVPAVTGMSKQFDTFGQVLDDVAKAIEALSITLKMTAWLSLGATAAAAAYLDQIRPNFTNAAAKMRELAGDLKSAINSYQNGDNTGSKRFC
jgi:uncharacterized phage infection (PIP) family protein YhgE